ncbi:MAG: alpha/beta hydrolase, partial [Gammaproteobacteria bacterium]|nr:alpha/beta hydrolase [Gammaproteobacteria bacterium]
EAQAALDQIFTRCAEDTACNERFPDLAAGFSKLFKKLEARSVTLKTAHPVTGQYESIKFGRDELAAALRLLAYHPNTIAMMPLLINEAAEGNYRPLVAQYQMTLTALSESISLGMHNAVMCSEDAPYYNDATIDSQRLNGTYMGPMQLDALQAICSVWPTGPVDDDLRQPLATDTPSLLLSGSADPITPPKYADMAAVGLQKAWLLTLPHQGHGQIGVGCMPQLFEKFIVGAGLDGIDLSCMDRSFVMPFFLDFTGPTP